MVEVGAEKPVEALAAHFALDSAQQQRAFFVRNQSTTVIGIAAGQREVENAVGFGQRGHLAIELPAAQRGLHFLTLAAVHFFDDAPFQVNGEALVKPEIAPGGVGDEVAGP